MRMLVLLGCLAALIGSCAIGAPRWTTPGAHVVDGYWLAEETPCRLEVPDGEACDHAVPLAVEALLQEDPGAVIVGTWTAHSANEWLDANGERRAINSTGVGGEVAVVLELDDGRRRVVGAMCPMGAGVTVGTPGVFCYVSKVSGFRVGEEPWT